MTPELETRLKYCTSLPTIPSVAMKILDLSKDPDLCAEDVSGVVRLDPALSSKLLRIANSPIYSRISKTENLQQALTLLGVDASVNLALSFALVNGLQPTSSGSTLDYDLVWRRSYISAVSCRLFGETLRLGCLEELFLAGLLQDFGVLALDRIMPEQYPALFNSAEDLSTITTDELKAFGTNHAEVGAWLLADWNLPEKLVDATRNSHGNEGDGAHDDQRFSDCVLVSGLVADLWLNDHYSDYYQKAAIAASQRLGIEADAFVEYLSRLSELIPDTAALFETQLAWPGQSEMILEHAKEVQLTRELSRAQN